MGTSPFYLSFGSLFFRSSRSRPTFRFSTSSRRKDIVRLRQGQPPARVSSSSEAFLLAGSSSRKKKRKKKMKEVVEGCETSQATRRCEDFSSAFAQPKCWLAGTAPMKLFPASRHRAPPPRNGIERTSTGSFRRFEWNALIELALSLSLSVSGHVVDKTFEVFSMWFFDLKVFGELVDSSKMEGIFLLNSFVVGLWFSMYRANFLNVSSKNYSDVVFCLSQVEFSSLC